MDSEYLSKLKQQVTVHGEMSVNDKTVILNLIAEIERLLRQADELKAAIRDALALAKGEVKL